MNVGQGSLVQVAGEGRRLQVTGAQGVEQEIVGDRR